MKPIVILNYSRTKKQENKNAHKYKDKVYELYVQKLIL